jgi:hypothetical protein
MDWSKSQQPMTLSGFYQTAPSSFLALTRVYLVLSFFSSSWSSSGSVPFLPPPSLQFAIFFSCGLSFFHFCFQFSFFISSCLSLQSVLFLLAQREADAAVG